MPPLNAGAPLLEARGLCKFYGDREVLHHVDLSIHPGEIVTVVGPNGAGKSTLLNCLLALETLDYGTVTRAPGLRIGYVPQHFVSSPSLPMTAGTFLALFEKRGRAAATRAIAASLGISSLLTRPLSALSGGEVRRLLLARALMNQPQLLVLDEPTAGVDVGGQAELYALLQQLSQAQGFSVLMVSHDLYVVMAASQRVICLNHHVCCEGTPQHVGGDANFRAMFGDALADQIALYHHHHTHRHGLGDEDYPHDTHEGHRHG